MCKESSCFRGRAPTAGPTGTPRAPGTRRSRAAQRQPQRPPELALLPPGQRSALGGRSWVVCTGVLHAACTACLVLSAVPRFTETFVPKALLGGVALPGGRLQPAATRAGLQLPSAPPGVVCSPRRLPPRPPRPKRVSRPRLSRAPKPQSRSIPGL